MVYKFIKKPYYQPQLHSWVSSFLICLQNCCFERETGGKKDPVELGWSLSYACTRSFIYSAQSREMIKT